MSSKEWNQEGKVRAEVLFILKHKYAQKMEVCDKGQCDLGNCQNKENAPIGKLVPIRQIEKPSFKKSIFRILSYF